MRQLLNRFPSLPYTAPFIVFISMLAVRSALDLTATFEYPLRITLVTLVLLAVSRGVISWKSPRIAQSTLIGIAVFFIWVAPDILFSGYRDHWLFKNSIVGTAESTLPLDARSNILFLACRIFGAVIIVPIIEELFWRAWLMRYVIDSDFQRVPLGAYSPSSFWVTAMLFASEHGPYWEVGLAAGLIYNWWIIRTKNLFDCILCHAVTNAVLSLYVIGFDKWQYWS
jgi:uncharacterized protein